MKSLPAVLVLALGGFLMTRRSKSRPNPDVDEIPMSMDYDDPELHDMLSESDESDLEDESELEVEDEL